MKRLTIFSTVVVVLATAWTAAAKPTAHREELDMRSRTRGMDRKTVPLLVRTVGPGSESRTADVVSLFKDSGGSVHTRDLKKYETKHDYVWAEGEGWFVQVRGNGDWIRYRRTDYLHSYKNPHRALKDAPNEARMVGVAQSFVRSELAALVPLDRNEKLEHFRTVRETYGSEHRATREKSESVISTEVVFTRQINGVDVLGAGSKVMVMLANDGAVVGFDVDWSLFEDVGVQENIVELPVIKGRSVAATMVAKDGRSNRLSRYECGYFDVGSARADPGAFLQPACISHLLTTNSLASGIVVNGGLIEVTPAGENPERDSAWPEVEEFTK